MKRVIQVLCLSLLCCNLISAQEKTPSTPKPKNVQIAGEPRESANLSAAKLPVRRVVLYKNGVGYFEHLGHVRGSQDVHVDFTSAQLNDVLKSLTVLDLSGGKISGVDYNSEAPLARRLATLRLTLGENPTMAGFLGALRGARLEVRSGSGAVMAGKLLSVEQKSREKDKETTEWTEISLVSDGGEVRSTVVTPTTSVRIAEKDLQAEVGRYLGLIASSRDQDLRRMTISATGAGERNLYVSYISEVPIWKTTYRIVLPSKAEKKPLLQGWAIVDNTIGEDWNDVEVSLVAGAPHSFIQQLSQPYYGRRPVVPLPESVQLTPQTHAAALDTMGSGMGFGSGPARGFLGGVPGGVAGGSMGGVIGGVIGGMGGAPPPPKPARVDEAEVEEAREESEPVAEGNALGDLFEYKLKERVTIRKNQSALVPILQTDIAAEKVSLWNESLGEARPLRALWVDNASSLTLDGGSFSVLDSNTFAGEGLVEAIKPGEKRLLSYATDLGLLVDTKLESARERVTRVRIYRGAMTTTSEDREKKTYIVRNEDSTPRTLVIEHPARPEWKLREDGAKPEEKAAGLYRFRLDVEAKKTERLVVNEAKPLYSQYTLNAVTNEEIDLLLRQKSINADIEKSLRTITAQKKVVADFDGALKDQQKAIDQIFTDQARLRENMKALKGSAEERTLLQRYTKQLDEEETQLDAIRRTKQDTEVQQKLANSVLQNMIQELQMDVTL
ncbi:MAG: hypothetical protein JWN63_1932 [Candidatus Acidoferrum typicum]|nr:hypothetical protein [Candidatus Acidoferrum typicum]